MKSTVRLSILLVVAVFALMLLPSADGATAPASSAARHQQTATPPFNPTAVFKATARSMTATADVLPSPTPTATPLPPPLRILAAPEHRPLEPLIQQFEAQTRADIQLEYRSSLDIALLLQGDGALEYDAVWPASSLWLTLAGRNDLSFITSIWRSPVVVGLKRSVAEDLGWIEAEVTTQMFIEAAADLDWLMPSASQTNSGALAFLGYLGGLASAEGQVTSADLSDPALTAQLETLLGTVARTSSSVGRLREVERYDAIVDTEAALIATNLELEARAHEPLYLVTLSDGTAFADAPLALVGDAAARETFLAWRDYLTSAPVRVELLRLGMRPGGMLQEAPPADVFRPEWGIDPTRPLMPIIVPPPDVAHEALTLYQSTLRKPSFTIYCLDSSGSMAGMGEAQLVGAMETLLDQEMAAPYFLQATAQDRTVVLPFDSVLRESRRATGNDPHELGELFTWLEQEVEPHGGTNIYAPVMGALDIIAAEGTEGYLPAIILMTDGQSNEGSLAELAEHYEALGLDVPVYAIMFGDADEAQLEAIAALTTGRVYDGRTDLFGAFRAAKGNN